MINQVSLILTKWHKIVALKQIKLTLIQKQKWIDTDSLLKFAYW